MASQTVKYYVNVNYMLMLGWSDGGRKGFRKEKYEQGLERLIEFRKKESNPGGRGLQFGPRTQSPPAKEPKVYLIQQKDWSD